MSFVSLNARPKNQFKGLKSYFRSWPGHQLKCPGLEKARSMVYLLAVTENMVNSGNL